MFTIMWDRLRDKSAIDGHTNSIVDKRYNWTSVAVSSMIISVRWYVRPHSVWCLPVDQRLPLNNGDAWMSSSTSQRHIGLLTDRYSATRVTLLTTTILVSSFAAYQRMNLIVGEECRRRFRCWVCIESVERVVMMRSTTMADVRNFVVVFVYGAVRRHLGLRRLNTTNKTSVMMSHSYWFIFVVIPRHSVIWLYVRSRWWSELCDARDWLSGKISVSVVSAVFPVADNRNISNRFELWYTTILRRRRRTRQIYLLTDVRTHP